MPTTIIKDNSYKADGITEESTNVSSGSDNDKTKTPPCEVENSSSCNRQYAESNSFFSSMQEVIDALSTNVFTKKGTFVEQNFASPLIGDTLFSEKSAEEKIFEANNKAREALLGSYIKEEGLRQQRQKPITIAIIILLSVQLILFNVLIFILVLNGAKTIESEIFSHLLDFLKYYIGAVVVELLGLIATITANTFSSNLSKNISKMFYENK